MALGPDVTVTPGVNTYSVPLSPLLANQQVYIRTLGMNIRDHVPLGNLTWTLREVHSAGVPLTNRVLETFNNGESEGGLQGALVNFDGTSVLETPVKIKPVFHKTRLAVAHYNGST